jgi:hypothetical protein
MRRTSSTRLTACPTPNFIGFINSILKNLWFVRWRANGAGSLNWHFSMSSARRQTGAPRSADLAITDLAPIWRAAAPFGQHFVKR